MEKDYESYAAANSCDVLYEQENEEKPALDIKKTLLKPLLLKFKGVKSPDKIGALYNDITQTIFRQNIISNDAKISLIFSLFSSYIHMTRRVVKQRLVKRNITDEMIFDAVELLLFGARIGFDSSRAKGILEDMNNKYNEVEFIDIYDKDFNAKMQVIYYLSNLLGGMKTIKKEELMKELAIELAKKELGKEELEKELAKKRLKKRELGKEEQENELAKVLAKELARELARELEKEGLERKLAIELANALTTKEKYFKFLVEKYYHDCLKEELSTCKPQLKSIILQFVDSQIL